ncbi:MAG: hypothetical protein J6Q15_00295 [Clostridia bacterium]|nr:hypothetical protein [Clostridia bacterium]
MNIIKKLIIRNQLKKELKIVDDTLAKSDYYAMESQLMRLAYYPDEYARVYHTIESKFRPLLNKKIGLQKDIQKLSGKNLFTNMYDLEK